MTTQSEKDRNDRIIQRLRAMPEVTPPARLRQGIMASLTPKKPGVWQRLRRFLFQPHTITIVPIKWAPVMAGLLLVAVLPRLMPIERLGGPATETMAARQASLTLTFEDPEARQVALIGSFNRWMPDSRVKTERRGSLWVFHLEVDPGRYEYAFLVNGREVVPDPRAVFRRNDGFGTANSIVYATVNGPNTI